ncbi:MAG TPA: Gfo/Idh/MocA family oxidoreductase [Longimicrobiales bacterium]
MKPTATLVGYGNYAKTVVVPNLRHHVMVQRIHEIDPLQIPPDDWSVTWDTAPLPRSDDESDLILVAGFHYTHAPIAVQALARGRYAVVEKPVTTDACQAGELVAAVRREQKFFACFHKHYLPFNDYARDDLRIDVGDPLSYHCILYEVPLPALHWYRWPNSRSRIGSNSCHWLDHFLFLNEFTKAVEDQLQRRNLKMLALERAGAFSWQECARETYSALTDW